MNRIQLRETLPVPQDVLWRALSDPAGLSAWFGATVTGELRPGAHLTFRWHDGTTRVAVVEEVDPGRKLAFRWLAFERAHDGTPHHRGSGRVELTVEPSEAGTVLCILEVGPDAPAVRAARRHDPRAVAVMR